MSKKIKTLVSTLVIAMALSTTAFAAPINTTNTFDGDKGADIVTQSDGTETQYFQSYDGIIYNNLPTITKTVIQGEKGNTLKYNVNAITNPNGASDVEHHIEESQAYVTLNNIERESGFGKLRLVYSTQPVTVTFNGTNSFNVKNVLKAKNCVMDNGNLAYAELGNDASQYLVNAVGQAGVSSCEIKDPGLYVVQLQNATLGHGLTMLVYIAQPGENITSNNNSKVAVPTTVDFNVNGSHNSVPMYQLNGSNYIRVRDLAYILNGTGRQVGISQNAGTDTTSINTVATLDNQSGGYKAIGGELASLPAYTMSAEPSVHNLAKNGSGITPSMYTINGQDFVSLKALDSILGLNMQVYSDGVVINAPKATAISASVPSVTGATVVILVNSNDSKYKAGVQYAKATHYNLIDCAGKTAEQIKAEIDSMGTVKRVRVMIEGGAPADVTSALSSKYSLS